MLVCTQYDRHWYWPVRHQLSEQRDGVGAAWTCIWLNACRAVSSLCLGLQLLSHVRWLVSQDVVSSRVHAHNTVCARHQCMHLVARPLLQARLPARAAAASGAGSAFQAAAAGEKGSNETPKKERGTCLGVLPVGDAGRDLPVLLVLDGHGARRGVHDGDRRVAGSPRHLLVPELRRFHWVNWHVLRYEPSEICARLSGRGLSKIKRQQSVSYQGSMLRGPSEVLRRPSGVLVWHEHVQDTRRKEQHSFRTAPSQCTLCSAPTNHAGVQPETRFSG